MSRSPRTIVVNRDDMNVRTTPEARLSPRQFSRSPLSRFSPRNVVASEREEIPESPAPSSGSEDIDSSASEDSATLPTQRTGNVKKQDVAGKPDIRLWLLQNQLSTLREEVYSYHSTLRASLHDMKDELKQENESFSVKVNRNESAWNTQFSHLTRHIQQQVAEVKKYYRDEVVKKQLVESEVVIMEKVQNEHILPVQVRYREIETALQYQSKEVRDAVEQQQLSLTNLEKNVNVRKLVVDSLEKQVQSLSAELHAIQKEWKNASSKLDESSTRLESTVETLSKQWTDQQSTMLAKMEKNEDEVLFWGVNMNHRAAEHEVLQAKVQEQEELIKGLRDDLEAREKFDGAAEELRVSLTEQAKELASTKEGLNASHQEFKVYQSEKEQEQNEFEQELDERHKMFTKLQTTVEVQGQELQAVRAELEAGRLEREEVQKEIAKNMEMQNTLFDYLVKQVQNQTNEIKLAHSNLSTFQQQYTATTADLEKKIETRKVLTDRLSATMKQHGSDLQAAQLDRDAMRRLISSNMDVCSTQDEIMQEKLADHEMTVAALLKQHDEAHDKFLAIVAPQTETLLRQIKLQDEELQALKLNKQALDEALTQSVKAMSSEMETLGTTVKEQETKLLQETKELSTQLTEVKIALQDETNKVKEDHSKLQEVVAKHQDSIDGLQLKVGGQDAIAETIQSFMRDTHTAMQTCNEKQEEGIQNLAKEIESHNVQFEQMDERVKHQDERIGSTTKKISSVKKELESKINIKDILFESLIRQVQQQSEEMKKHQVAADEVHSTIRQRIATNSDQIDQLTVALKEQGEDIKMKFAGEVEAINNKFFMQEEARENDKQEQAEVWAALDESLALSKQQFDDLSAQVQTTEEKLQTAKEELSGATRNVEMSFETKSSKFNEVQEQLKFFGEFLEAEKNDRTTKEAEIRKAIVHEKFFRSEVLQAVEHKLLDMKDEVLKLDEDLLIRTREERDWALEVFSQKLATHDAEFKEVHLQLLDCVDGLQKVDDDIAEVKHHNKKIQANFEDATNQLEKKIKEASDKVEDVVDRQVEHSSSFKGLKDQVETDIETVEGKIGRMEGFINNLRATLAGIVRVDNGPKLDTPSASKGESSQEAMMQGFMRDMTKQIEDIKATRNDTAKTPAEEESWKKRLEQLEQRVVQQAFELSAAQDFREGVEEELQKKNTSLKVVEQQLEETSVILKETKWENRGLRVTLNGMQEHHNLLQKASGEALALKASDCTVSGGLEKNGDSFQTANDEEGIDNDGEITA